jgi:hypothetical protein
MVVTVRWMQYIVMNDAISSLFLFSSPPQDSIIASPPSSDVTSKQRGTTSLGCFRLPVVTKNSAWFVTDFGQIKSEGGI